MTPRQAKMLIYAVLISAGFGFLLTGWDYTAGFLVGFGSFGFFETRSKP